MLIASVLDFGAHMYSAGIFSVDTPFFITLPYFYSCFLVDAGGLEVIRLEMRS